MLKYFSRTLTNLTPFLNLFAQHAALICCVIKKNYTRFKYFTLLTKIPGSAPGSFLIDVLVFLFYFEMDFCV